MKNLSSKKNKTFEYILFFCFLLLFCFFIFLDYIKYIRYDQLETKLMNRTLAVSNKKYDETSTQPELELSHFLTLEHVVDAYSYYVPNSQDIMPNHTIYIQYQSLKDLHMINGTKQLQKGEMVLSSFTIKKLGYNENQIIGKEFSFTFQNNPTILKVVGVYEGEEEYAYITESDMKDHFLMMPTDNMYQVVVDKYSNVDHVIETLETQNYHANISNNTGIEDIKIYDFFLELLQILFYFICSIVILLGIVIIKNILYEQKKDIAILKTIGYHNIHLFLFILYSILTIFLFTYIGTLLSFSTLLGIIGFYIKDIWLYMENHILTIILYDLQMFLLITLLAFLTVLASYPKIANLSPILLFKD